MDLEKHTPEGRVKRKKGIETAGRLAECAAELFAKKGYDHVSVREIADAAGIGESSFYNHFSGKAALLESLWQLFIEHAPDARPPLRDLEAMMDVMTPEEIFKHILFYFGSHVKPGLEQIAMVINNEKYRNPRAAEVYYRHVVDEPSEYYERLILQMIDRGLFKPVNAKRFAEQYNYVSITLTKEYFMAKNGMADLHTVIRTMIETIDFFCGLMKPT